MADHSDGIDALADLNLEIGHREARLDVDYFRDLLAPGFVMRRANEGRDTIGREAFLEALGQASPKERQTRIESVVLVGEERAIVTCVVTMDDRDFHNLRIFVRGPDDDSPRSRWLLMAWINEPIAPATS